MKPWAFDPCNIGVFVHLAVSFPDVVFVKTKEVFYRTGESAQIGRIKGYNVDAAHPAARVIEIRLIVVVNKNIHVKGAVPATLNVRCVLPFSHACKGPQRIVRFKKRAVISAHIETAIVFNDVGGNRNIFNKLERPIEHIVGGPCASAGTEHIEFALFPDDCDIAGRIPARRGNHW